MHLALVSECAFITSLCILNKWQIFMFVQQDMTPVSLSWKQTQSDTVLQERWINAHKPWNLSVCRTKQQRDIDPIQQIPPHSPVRSKSVPVLSRTAHSDRREQRCRDARTSIFYCTHFSSMGCHTVPLQHVALQGWVNSHQIHMASLHTPALSAIWRISSALQPFTQGRERFVKQKQSDDWNANVGVELSACIVTLDENGVSMQRLQLKTSAMIKSRKYLPSQELRNRVFLLLVKKKTNTIIQ